MHRLRATIPSSRIARYDSACAGTGIDGMDLYRWAAAVALAVFDDISVVEVAMRSAMARELAAVYGMSWYRRDDLLDDDTLRLVADAWRMGRLAALDAPDHVIHGKLVATLMLGFWVKLLGRGAYRGASDSRQRRIYDTLLWKAALRKAFPHAGDLDRGRVEAAARRVQALRNRIAHHEHIIWGVPLAGERLPDGTPIRQSVAEAHATLLRLAGFVDAGLEGWLVEHSRVRAVLAACPLPDTSSLALT